MLRAIPWTLLAMAAIHAASAAEPPYLWKEGASSPVTRDENGGKVEIHWFRTFDQAMGVVILSDLVKLGPPKIQVCDRSEIIYEGVIGVDAGNGRVAVKELTPYPPVEGGRFDLIYYAITDTKSGAVFFVPFDQQRNRFDNDITDALIMNMIKYMDHDKTLR